MNPRLDALNLINAPAQPNATTGANNGNATTAPGEAGVFAQLLGSYATATLAQPGNTGDAAPASDADVAAALTLIPTPGARVDDATTPPPAQEVPVTPPVDAALIAALLGQMQTPYVMPVQSASAPRAIAPAPAETERTLAAVPRASVAAPEGADEPVARAAFAMPALTGASGMPETLPMAESNPSLQPPEEGNNTAAAPASFSRSAVSDPAAGTTLNKAGTQPAAASVVAPAASLAPLQLARTAPAAADANAAFAAATLPGTSAFTPPMARSADETGAQPASSGAAELRIASGTNSAGGEAQAQPVTAPQDASFRVALDRQGSDGAQTDSADSMTPPTVAASPAPQPRTAVAKTAREHRGDITVTVAAAAPAVIANRGDTTPPTVSITPPLTSSEWQPAFTHNVRLLVKEGASAASLQLNPAEFGPIDVRITVTDQRADIAFMVTHPDANAAIQSALSDLRDQLARSGIQLGQTSVGAHPQDPRQQAATPQRGTPAGPAVAAAPVSAPPAPIRSRGKIDVYA